MNEAELQDIESRLSAEGEDNSDFYYDNPSAAVDAIKGCETIIRALIAEIRRLQHGPK